MGLLNWLTGGKDSKGRGVDQLAALLKMGAGELAAIRPGLVPE